MNLIERLTYENQILRADGLEQFQIYRGDNAGYYLLGTHQTNAGNRYSLWAPLPSGFPEAPPPLYIHSPNPLWAFGNARTVNSFGLSHAMHTLQSGPGNEVQICHWRPGRWHSGITLNRVMLKGILWLEAYEQHFATGKDINDFVRTMA